MRRSARRTAFVVFPQPLVRVRQPSAQAPAPTGPAGPVADPRFDTIVGQPLPGEVAGLFRDILSPYCPGLTLDSCPSPQADSLRRALHARFDAGESVAQLTASLRQDYGPDVIGKPPINGIGAAAWFGPVVVLIIGTFVIQRWLRRNQRRRADGVRTARA